MAMSTWFRPPRHLLILFLGIMGLLASALGWLGWRLLQQDRALADQQIRARLEATADAATAELARRISGTEETLTRLAAVSPEELSVQIAKPAADLEDGALFVVLDGDGIDAFPRARLLYYPSLRSTADPPATVFARGESLEFRQRDYPGAIRAYRTLAQSADSATRAGGLLRLGRVLRKAKQHESALSTYADLAQMGRLRASGLPAGLIGGYGRLEVLHRLGREEELHEEASGFRSALAAGEWPITRAAYEFYTQDLERLLPPDERIASAPSRHSFALADGVESLWQLGIATVQGDRPEGRRTVLAREQPVLLVWRGGPEHLVAFVASGEFLESVWLGEFTQMLAQQGMTLALSDAAGNPVFAPFDGDATHEIIRVAAQTGLPWNLHVASVDPSVVLADLEDRRRLMLAGALTVALLILFGAYAVTRAIRREMEVARLQSEFVSAVSHEFRTPLTSMRQLTELLSSGRVPSEERRAEYYAVIKRESERLHRLVEGLLDFGRMEAGALEFSKEPLTIDDLVNEVVDAFRAEQGDAGSSVVFDSADGGMTVYADREALSRALWNLLDNAVKYSPENAAVRVDVAANGDRISVSVRDHGIGMSPEELEGIFEKFVRGTASRSLSVKGTGIGLAMVRHIVEAHDGDVHVESVPGEGSTFTILLPIDEKK